MNYTFDIDDATKYGVDEAIMLNNLKFWLRKNKVNERHNHDGHTWTYNSKKGFAELFPFWSPRQIERIINSLKKQGLIITGNYNKMKFDHTLWYAFVDEKLLELPITPNGAKEESKRWKGGNQTVEPIPDSKPDNKQNIPFESFWDKCEKKEGKKKAAQKWSRMSNKDRQKAFDGIEGFQAGKKREYISAPAAYLNGERWEDEASTESGIGSNQFAGGK